MLKIKEKSYKFSIEGLNQAIADNKQEKIDNVINIGFWSVILTLGAINVITTDKIISIIACSGTSKFVKYIMR